jgi:hypothetical protein
LLITGTGAAGLLFKALWKPREPKSFLVLKPRYRKHTNIPVGRFQLERGFHINTKSQVIHYLPDGKETRFTRDIAASRLKPYDPTTVPINQQNPRVNVSRASYAFEQAAVTQFMQNNLDKGCQLLFYAINYELSSADKNGRSLAAKSGPSFRLYDLLAGMSVRFDRMDYLERMIRLIEGAGDALVRLQFQDRIKKWQDPNGRWYRRWSDKNLRVKWTVDKLSGLVLLM